METGKSSDLPNRRILYVSVGFGLLLLFLGVCAGMDFTTLRNARALEARWREMEEDVDAAARLKVDSARIDEASETLRGWRDSRYNWPGFLNTVFLELAGQSGQVKISRLYFDEEMEGMREQLPGETDRAFLPLTRRVDMMLYGRILSENPVGDINNRFRSALRENPVVSPMLDAVYLGYMKPLLDRDREQSGENGFLLIFEFLPRELTP